jgi:ubiquitin-activating enzyme E1
MYTYPLDCKTKDGKLFWSLPKRPPTVVEFNINDPIHCSVITAIACLRAKIYKIKIPDNPRNEKVI